MLSGACRIWFGGEHFKVAGIVGGRGRSPLDAGICKFSKFFEENSIEKMIFLLFLEKLLKIEPCKITSDINNKFSYFWGSTFPCSPFASAYDALLWIDVKKSLKCKKISNFCWFSVDEQTNQRKAKWNYLNFTWLKHWTFFRHCERQNFWWNTNLAIF